MKRSNFIFDSLRGLGILCRVMPDAVIWTCISQFFHGLFWMLQVVSLQYFFDTVTEAGEKGFDLVQVSMRLLLMGCAYLFAQIMNGVANCYGEVQDKRAAKEMNRLIFRKVDRLDAVSFENAESLNRMNRAIKGGQSLFGVSTAILDIVFFYCIYFGMMSWYLFSQAPVLSVSIFIIFVPNVIAKLLQKMNFKRLEEAVTPLRRKCSYYEKCMTDKEYYKETRLLGCVDYFKSLYVETLCKINRLQFKTQLKKEAVNFVINVLTVLAYGGIIGLLVCYVWKGEISVGVFAAVLASLREFYNFMDEVISERFAGAAENLAAVENFLDFIQGWEKEKESLSLPIQPDICLKEVAFAYPDAKEGQWAMEGINLVIPWGQTVALVGENGSGKSTLCSVIAGLYAPTRGELSYKSTVEAGIPAARGENFGGISAVFQKYCRYHMTLRENVCISETDKPQRSGEIMAACTSAGVDMERIGGLEEMLGKEFGGTELSGGQWQGIAIARGLYRGGQIMILDEPTAAIDPLEENWLYLKFREICKERTAVLVTHRLASARMADRILVMKDGRIVQDGSHEQLVSVDGEYRRLYDIQKKWYEHGGMENT